MARGRRGIMGGMKYLITFVGLFACVATALANDWYVDDSVLVTGDGSSGSPYKTILEAVLAADGAPGSDTIHVADGTYTGPGVNADFGGNQTTIVSDFGPIGGPANCIIDGGGVFSGFGFTAPGTTGSIVKGFTFRNMGDTAQAGGSAIRVTGATIEIRDCIFKSNVSNAFFQGGGAVSLFNSGTKIVNCQFSDNTFAPLSSGSGGAVFVQNCNTARIQTCTFTNNSAEVGGAIYCDNGSVVVETSSFKSNTAGSGGAVYAGPFGVFHGRSLAFASNSATTGGGGAICSNNAMLLVVNCTVVGNSAPVLGGGAIHSTTSSGSKVYNSIFLSNGSSSGLGGTPADLSFSYCHVEGFPTSGTNSGADPMLSSIPNDLSLEDGSPCIDSGSTALYQNVTFQVTKDLDGIHDMPLGFSIDRGAYEKVDAVAMITLIKRRVDLVVGLPADGHPLKQKLDQAASAIRAGNISLAIQRLNEFIAKVNEWYPKKLSLLDRDDLITMASDVIDEIGGP